MSPRLRVGVLAKKNLHRGAIAMANLIIALMLSLILVVFAIASVSDSPETVIFVFVCLMLLLYLLPALIAWTRKHRNAVVIGVINVLLGWTLIGWVIALVWAFKDPVVEVEKKHC